MKEKVHQGPIVCVDFHPKASCVASVEAAGVLKLWQPASRQGPHHHRASSSSMSFLPGTPQWDKHATVAWTYTAPRVQRKAGESLRAAPQREAVLTCCAFSPGAGAVLALGGLNACLTLFDVSAMDGGSGAGRQQRHHHNAIELWRQPRGDTVALAWAPDGRTLATVDRRHTISLWRIPHSYLLTHAEEAAEAQRTALLGDENDNASAQKNKSGEVPTLLAQYLNQPLPRAASAGLALYPPSSRVMLAFLDGGRRLLFQHAQENCVKIWRMQSLDDDDGGTGVGAVDDGKDALRRTAQNGDGANVGAKGSVLPPPHSRLQDKNSPANFKAPPLSRHVPVLFHCDRLTSSADLNLIHFLEHA
jgi:WD40 repeat protein